MIYKNPIVKGFYPDPSVCRFGDKFYMVCSSFQYFPGVPLFESEDLVNWQQIGYVLTRKSQVMLEGINSSGGVFAPTIRCCPQSGGSMRFYMVTTNDTTHQNFYVYTDDIYGEWSEPIFVAQGGIDPSLYFEFDVDSGKYRTYFMSNGCDDEGKSGVVQCEIDVENGKKLSKSVTIWQGSGGRFLESPHLYKIGKFYYLMAAEGGTEYGHMVTYSRGESVWGPFASYPQNPVLTNRNKAPYIIQGIGHGDLICDKSGEWHILSLGFRQEHIWQTYHHLGREVFLTPVSFGEDGWFTAGKDGTTDESYEIDGDFEQCEKKVYTFENTDWNVDWCFIRHPDLDCYQLGDDFVVLNGTEITLDDVASPTFIGLRQRDFCGKISCKIKFSNKSCVPGRSSFAGGEAGITLYMSESEHYDVAINSNGSGFEALLKLNIGNIKHIEKRIPIRGNTAKLIIKMDNFTYKFSVIECDNQDDEADIDDISTNDTLGSAGVSGVFAPTDSDCFAPKNTELELGYGLTKYLSSEVSGGFTGVMIGLFADGDGSAYFSEFECCYD